MQAPLNYLISVGLAGAVLLIWKRRSIYADTTLRSPALWLCASLAAAAMSRFAFAADWFEKETTHRAVEFVVLMTTLCPVVAVMGAKRPQHGVWNFVVFSLLLVLALPSAEVLFIRSGAHVRIHGLRMGFILLLVAMGGANYLSTRFSVMAGCFVLGQLCLFFQLLDWGGVPWIAEVGYAFLVAAVALACLGIPSRKLKKQSWDRTWLDFRDAFGNLWALRVRERLNQTANKLDWQVRLNWGGFEPATSKHEEALSPSVERCFRMLLRRFVDESWYEGCAVTNRESRKHAADGAS